MFADGTRVVKKIGDIIVESIIWKTNCNFDWYAVCYDFSFQETRNDCFESQKRCALSNFKDRK